MERRPDAPAALRNREPILEVLRSEFQASSSVLEIGSGTGQHAVFFAEAMPHLHWQTSDLEGNHAGIEAWIDWAKLDNVGAPLLLDMGDAHTAGRVFDAVYSSNTAHIMHSTEVEKMFEFVGKILPDNGIFCLYGPFNEGGRFSSDSNERFDESLRRQDEKMGIRDLDDLRVHAGAAGMTAARRYAMPANNQIIVWVKNEQMN